MDAARWVRAGEVADPSEISVAVALKLLYRRPPLRAMAWFRLATLASERGVRGVPDYLRRRLLRLYGLELVPGAQIGGGLYIAHPVGCTLIVESIGSNVSVMGGNTLGRLTELRWPVLGDRVFLGTGAKVLGGVKIGDDAVVGANAVVLIDVPAGANAVGVPAHLTG
jgi:serine O-acetyltransferase